MMLARERCSQTINRALTHPLTNTVVKLKKYSPQLDNLDNDVKQQL